MNTGEQQQSEGKQEHVYTRDIEVSGMIVVKSVMSLCIAVSSLSQPSGAGARDMTTAQPTTSPACQSISAQEEESGDLYPRRGSLCTRDVLE